jgi:hypothetical protein
MEVPCRECGAKAFLSCTYVDNVENRARKKVGKKMRRGGKPYWHLTRIQDQREYEYHSRNTLKQWLFAYGDIFKEDE